MDHVLLVRYGEVHLKGANRPYFLKKLLSHVQRAAKPLGGQARLEDGRIYVSNLYDIQEGIARICRVFGVHSVSPAVALEKDDKAIYAQAIELMQGKTGSFKVFARRSDKLYPLDSPALAAAVGERVLDAHPHLTVDVRHPVHRLSVEIREMAYLYVDETPAVGGMPMGTNGKAMLLLSGGIDSPVAGYQIAKRGVVVECVHFHSFPYTSEQAKEKVLSLARILSRFCGPVRVFVVPFTDIQTTLHKQCKDTLLTILMRRFMMRIAQEIALSHGGQALITGESIGQVASQTMEGLCATDDAVTMPVFRPLIGLDKQEIIDIAQRIDTLETSNLPYEDCCTIFTPRHPSTHPQLEQIRMAEEGLDIAAMVQKAIDGMESHLMQED